MSVTKYIAPIAMIAIGVASGGIGFAAMAAGDMAAISAGAMVAGGAMSLVGTATGSKDLTEAGQIIGLAGGIGSAFTGPATGSMLSDTASETTDAAVAAKNSAETAAGGLPGSADSMAATPSSIANSGAAAPGGASGTTTAVGATATPSASVATKMAADTSAQQLLKYNMMTQAIGGIGNAVGARTTADIQARTSANQLGFQASLANRANTVGSNASMTAAPLAGNAGGTGLLSMNPVAAPTLQRP
jgi:hypothetical protein